MPRYNYVHPYVQADLSILLDDTPQSYYWVGLLAADGCFYNNRLRLSLSIRDKSHVIKFAEYIKCPNHRNDSWYSYGVQVKDVYNVPKIIKKFDFKKAKTYHPPDIRWMSRVMLIPFFIGFIDGDGSIGYQYKRKDCCIRIKNHSSWLSVLQFMVEVMAIESGVKTPQTKINKQGYANVNIVNSVALKFLKKKTIEFNLPILERKWSKIDEDFVSRQEQAVENRKNVIVLKSEGLTNKQISNKLGLSKAAVSVILKKVRLNENS